MQRTVGNAAVQRVVGAEENPLSGVLAGGGGEPLRGPVRQDMEARFGTDFSDVRVHTGASAHESAASVNAHAFTAGSNVVFQRGMYDPDSTSGRTMLAHELTHVVQQRSGPVDGTPTGQGYQVSHPSDRFEREAAANSERIVAMPVPAAAASLTTASSPAASAAVQREAQEDEAVQGVFVPGETRVQREGAEEEPES